MKVLRTACLAKPKHQSGENLVWPATRKEYRMLQCKPTINYYSPGIIPKKVIVFILTSVVVCVDIGICLTKPKVLKKVMD